MTGILIVVKVCFVDQITVEKLALSPLNITTGMMIVAMTPSLVVGETIVATITSAESEKETVTMMMTVFLDCLAGKITVVPVLLSTELMIVVSDLRRRLTTLLTTLVIFYLPQLLYVIRILFCFKIDIKERIYSLF